MTLTFPRIKPPVAYVRYVEKTKSRSRINSFMQDLEYILNQTNLFKTKIFEILMKNQC